MTSAVPTSPAQQLKSEFEESELKLRRSRAIVSLALGVGLMPAGLIPDWLLYPQSFSSLVAIRLAGTLILALGLWLIWKVDLKRSFEPISLFLIYSPAAAMALMMYVTDGGQSSYYFGLIILMIIVHMLGFRIGEAIVFCVLTVLAYLIAVFSHPAVKSTAQTELVQGIFFLSTTAVVCVAVCHVSRRNRWTAFRLQRELRDERLQLEASMNQLRETESRLFQSEKVRAVAGLASGLLHEINNPVNYSMMAIRVLKKKLGKGPPESRGSELDTLSDIEEGVERIGNIVSDLRSFAHPDQQGEMTPFMLLGAVEKAVRFSANEIEEGVVQVTHNETMRASVLGSESQITQVLLNLFMNANLAFDNRFGVSERQIKVDAETINDRVRITVRDNGKGMSPEQIDKVREPYYTTRTGEGLGLGLSICETIIKSHGGELRIQSEPNVGTQVSFDLATLYGSAAAKHDGDNGHTASSRQPQTHQQASN